MVGSGAGSDNEAKRRKKTEGIVSERVSAAGPDHGTDRRRVVRVGSKILVQRDRGWNVYETEHMGVRFELAGEYLNIKNKDLREIMGFVSMVILLSHGLGTNFSTDRDREGEYELVKHVN